MVSRYPDETRIAHVALTRRATPAALAIALSRAWGEDYYATPFFMLSVEFQRDSTGKVTGFLVNAGERVRNVLFVRAR